MAGPSLETQSPSASHTHVSGACRMSDGQSSAHENLLAWSMLSQVRSEARHRMEPSCYTSEFGSATDQAPRSAKRVRLHPGPHPFASPPCLWTRGRSLLVIKGLLVGAHSAGPGESVAVL